MVILLLRAVIPRWLGRCYVAPRTTLTNLPPCMNIFLGKTLSTSKIHNKSVHKNNCVGFRLDFFLMVLFLSKYRFNLSHNLVYTCIYSSYNIFKNENYGNHSFHTCICCVPYYYILLTHKM